MEACGLEHDLQRQAGQARDVECLSLPEENSTNLLVIRVASVGVKNSRPAECSRAARPAMARLERSVPHLQLEEEQGKDESRRGTRFGTSAPQSPDRDGPCLATDLRQKPLQNREPLARCPLFARRLQRLTARDVALRRPRRGFSRPSPGTVVAPEVT